MPVRSPVLSQCGKGHLGKRHKPILAAFPQTHMHPDAIGINIAYLQIQRFTEPESHAVNSENVGLVSDLPGGVDDQRNLFRGQNIRQ